VSRLSEACQSVQNLVEERLRAPSEVWGLSTGIPAWDRLTGGLHPGEVTVIGARTGVGKSSLSIQLALNALPQLAERHQVVLVSPEMTTEGLVLRMASNLSRVPSRSVLRGTAGPEEVQRFRQALARIAGWEGALTILAGGRVKLTDLELKLTELDCVRRLGLVLVDYLNLIEVGVNSAYERATEVSRGIRALANALKVPIVLFSQLARPQDRSEEKPPTMFELRDSGNIEQDADNVLLLWRPPTEEGVRSQVTHCTLAKQRNGPVGSFRLYFLEDIHRFEPWKEGI